MRARAAALVLPLLLGCVASPAGPFDEGAGVHVIVRVSPGSTAPREIRPIVTIGGTVREVVPVTVAPGAPEAVEVAIVAAPAGEQRLAVWDPVLGSGARVTVDVEGELWALADLASDGRPARLRVYDEPPHEEAGAWRPLIAVPR